MSSKGEPEGPRGSRFRTRGMLPDQDQDGVDDFKDNCPRVANENQDNMDGDKWGDVCDPDIDNDGIMNPVDNRKELANEDQLDIDRDGIGQACDTSSASSCMVT